MPNTAGAGIGYDSHPTGTAIGGHGSMIEGSIAGDRYDNETSTLSPVDRDVGTTNEGERLRHSGY